MTFYRSICIDDASSEDDARLVDFIDCIDAESRRQLLSAKQQKGFLELVWRGATPSSWDGKAVHCDFRDGSFDEWCLCNRPYGGIAR